MFLIHGEDEHKRSEMCGNFIVSRALHIACFTKKTGLKGTGHGLIQSAIYSNSFFSVEDSRSVPRSNFTEIIKATPANLVDSLQSRGTTTLKKTRVFENLRSIIFSSSGKSVFFSNSRNFHSCNHLHSIGNSGKIGEWVGSLQFFHPELLKGKLNCKNQACGMCKYAI